MMHALYLLWFSALTIAVWLGLIVLLAAACVFAENTLTRLERRPRTPR